MAAKADPFDAAWVQTSLVERARRVAAGADPDLERERLFEELSDWAVDHADRQARKLPSQADRNEVRSRSLLAVWESTNRIDWDRPTAWPSLLKRKLRGALLDAARSDDPLSRRDRVELSRLREAVAEWEKRHGRSAGTIERRSHLDRIRAEGSTAHARLEMFERPVSLDSAPPDLAGLRDARPDPEELVLDRLEQAALRRWLQDVVPVPLARRLTAWAHKERAGTRLPNRLAGQVEPYVDALAAAAIDTGGRGRPLPTGTAASTSGGMPYARATEHEGVDLDAR